MINYFQLFNTSNLIREKLYKGLHNFSLQNYMHRLDINEIKIMFLLSNNILNKPVFYALLLILEKITLTNFTFIFTKKAIANFNIKKQLKLGAVYTLRNTMKDQFIRLFTSYSLYKIYSAPIFINKNTNQIRLSYHKDNIAFGLQKILFNVLFSSNIRDFELFSSIFENMIYGVHIYIYTYFRNYFINKLILSQYNILVV